VPCLLVRVCVSVCVWVHLCCFMNMYNSPSVIIVSRWGHFDLLSLVELFVFYCFFFSTSGAVHLKLLYLMHLKKNVLVYQFVKNICSYWSVFDISILSRVIVMCSCHGVCVCVRVCFLNNCLAGRGPIFRRIWH